MEYLSAEVGQVGHCEDKHRLQDWSVVGEPGHEARHVAPDDADDCATARHHNEAGESFANVSHVDVLLLNLHVGLEHVVQNHSHGIVQQGLSEHDDVQDLVNLYFFEHGEDSHGVDSRDERGEEESLEEPRSVVLTVDSRLPAAPESQA